MVAIFCVLFKRRDSLYNRSFPSSLGPLYQNEVRCSAFDMKEIFHSQANVTYFLEKGCAFGLILKARVLELGTGLLDFRAASKHPQNQIKIATLIGSTLVMSTSVISYVCLSIFQLS